MVVSDQTVSFVYEADNLHLSYDSENDILHCDWRGRQTNDTILKGGLVILQATRERSITKVLYNNARIADSCWDAAVWAADTWFPEMISAGMKHFALILPENIFEELSAERAIGQLSHIVRTFHSVDEARKWLQKSKAA